jgi:hypothetical protein
VSLNKKSGFFFSKVSIYYIIECLIEVDIDVRRLTVMCDLFVVTDECNNYITSSEYGC